MEIERRDEKEGARVRVCGGERECKVERRGVGGDEMESTCVGTSICVPFGYLWRGIWTFGCRRFSGW
eukprot:1341065-Amorphochlora_amoeboformis.AAC.1